MNDLLNFIMMLGKAEIDFNKETINLEDNSMVYKITVPSEVVFHFNSDFSLDYIENLISKL